jgi:hypothetical protein
MAADPFESGTTHREVGMDGTERKAQERIFTTGEKTLAAMIVAGVFGYWAGFNLGAPGEAAGLSVAAAAALPAAVHEAQAAPVPRDAAPRGDEYLWLDAAALRAVADRDEPAIPTF